MKNSEVVLTNSNAINFVLVSLSMAAKFYDDRFEKNTLFSAVAGLQRKHMRRMSDLFLDLIEFDLNTTEEIYNCYLSKLKTMVAEKFAKSG
jgi:hypothetical protein